MSAEMLRSPAHFAAMLTNPRDRLARALVLNGQQKKALANPSPECDSLIEVFDVITPDTPEEEIAVWHGRRIVTNVIRWNAVEGLHIGKTEADLDSTAGELHALRLAAVPLADRLTARSLARVLREPLSTLADPSGRGAAALLDATRTLCRVVAGTPRSQLLSPALAHELAPRKAALLRYLLADEEAGVAQLATGDPQDRADRRNGHGTE